MNLADPAVLKGLLKRHGVAQRKALGQHFLVSERVVEAVVAAATRGSDPPTQGVLEIGPGPGVLTGPLSETVPKVIALEVDPAMPAVLAESAPGAEIRLQDALKIDLRSVLADLPEPRAVVSNLPYYITGPLLGLIAEASSAWHGAVLMMQREVAERILAPVGDSARGSLSVWLQSEFAIQKVIDVPAGAFWPPPKVDSVVLQFRPQPSGRPTESYVLVREAFGQPRKTLANNLRSRGVDGAWLESRGIPGTIRAHQVQASQWIRLWEDLGLGESGSGIHDN